MSSNEQASDDAESVGDSEAVTHSRPRLPIGVGLEAQEAQRAVQHENAQRFRIEIAQHFDLETDQVPDRMVRGCLEAGSVTAYIARTTNPQVPPEEEEEEKVQESVPGQFLVQGLYPDSSKYDWLKDTQLSSCAKFLASREKLLADYSTLLLVVG